MNTLVLVAVQTLDMQQKLIARVLLRNLRAMFFNLTGRENVGTGTIKLVGHDFRNTALLRARGHAGDAGIALRDCRRQARKSTSSTPGHSP